VKKIVLIVAGGSGKRMNAITHKQFLLLRGLPVLMHTVDAFYRYDRQMKIIIVLPEEERPTWETLCHDYTFKIPHEIKSGGETRFHSVQKNLTIIPDHCLVAVHDGVRPLVSHLTIDRCFQAAMRYGNAVPGIEIPETLRRIGKKGTKQVNRSHYRLIQTPQVFDSSILKKAYLQPYSRRFTDDAGVVESMGYVIHLVEGNPENIKITYPHDLVIASSLISTIYKS